MLNQEIWNSPYSNDSFPQYAEDIDAGFDASPSTRMLSELAKSLQITIIGGSIPERSGDKLYNTCCVFGTNGELLAKHRKVYIFFFLVSFGWGDIEMIFLSDLSRREWYFLS